MYTPMALSGSLPSAKAPKKGCRLVCQRSRMARMSSARAISTSYRADVDVVLGAGRLEHLDPGEASIAEHLTRLVLAPRRAQAGAALRERHCHAVEHAHPVDVRREGIADVLLQTRGRPGLQHQVDAA